MGYGFGYVDPTYILLIPAVILAFYAQSKVQSAYRRYAAVRNRRGITGAEAARRILDSNGLHHVSIQPVQGTLTDHYDPRKQVMRLSAEVYQNATIASVSIAAHEAGHAIQDGQRYAALKLRNAIAPLASIASALSWPLLLIGLMIVSLGHSTGGYLIFNIGILLFVGVVLFHAITLPVEFNASKRAVRQLIDLGILSAEEEGGAKRVLSAAALTYVAAMAMAVSNLIRILAIRGRK